MKTIKANKIEMVLSINGNLKASLVYFIEKIQHTLIDVSFLNLKDIENIKKMCESKVNCLLFMKDKKLGELAKILTNNIPSDKIPVKDTIGQEPSFTIASNAGNTLLWPTIQGSSNIGITNNGNQCTVSCPAGQNTWCSTSASGFAI